MKKIPMMSLLYVPGQQRGRPRMKPVRQMPPTTIVFLGLQDKMVDIKIRLCNPSDVPYDNIRKL